MPVRASHSRRDLNEETFAFGSRRVCFAPSFQLGLAQPHHLLSLGNRRIALRSCGVVCVRPNYPVAQHRLASGEILVAGLRYAIENAFDVVNMSLSTTKRELAEGLHELADLAYFQKTMLVASAHNLPVESYPWRFASVLSVGSHDRDGALDFYYNPEPPVEFFARGVDIDVAWLQGSTLRCTGNSFATPHMTGICALVLGSHPELTPFQLKSVLYLTASNVIGSR